MTARERIPPYEVSRFAPPELILRDLPELVRRLATHNADRTIILDKTPAGNTMSVTRIDLWLRIRTLAEQLRDRGIGAGDCVASWLPNWSDALVWQFAAAARGAHLVGINTRYNVTEAAYILQQARPTLVALALDFHDLDLVGRLRDAVAASGVVPAVAAVPGPGGAAGDPTGADVGNGVWLPAPASGDPPELPPTDPDALAVAFTTSGSTGKPKLAAHRGASVAAHAMADAAAIGITQEDAVLCALPISGVFGYNTALAALAAGAVCVMQPAFDAHAALDDMETHRVSHVVGGDDLVLRLATVWNERPRDLSAWRWWGAADFQTRSQELAAWAHEQFGTSTSGVYGSSEVLALTALWPHDEPAPSRWVGGGRVVHDHIQVQVADPDTNEPVATGQDGELQFHGPNVVDSYLGGSGSDAFSPDGWFRTGDLGTIVAPGAFTYICRMGDALRLRGFLVDPAEIELHLSEHPHVDTAKVVGTTGPNGETIAIAFIVAKRGRSPEADALRSWCADTLAPFKVPQNIQLIDAMPITAGTNGTKIRTAELRDWAAKLQNTGQP